MSKILCIFYFVTAAVCVVMSDAARIRRSYQPTSECIRYEFHETFGNGSQVDSIMRNCQSHNGYLDKLTRFTMNKRSYLVNVTFECCGKCCSHYLVNEISGTMIDRSIAPSQSMCLARPLSIEGIFSTASIFFSSFISHSFLALFQSTSHSVAALMSSVHSISTVTFDARNV